MNRAQRSSRRPNRPSTCRTSPPASRGWEFACAALEWRWSGFAPNTQYAVVVAAADGSAPPDPVAFSVTTDASGAAVGESPDLSQAQFELASAMVDGVLSGAVTVIC